MVKQRFMFAYRHVTRNVVEEKVKVHADYQDLARGMVEGHLHQLGTTKPCPVSGLLNILYRLSLDFRTSSFNAML